MDTLTDTSDPAAAATPATPAGLQAFTFGDTTTALDSPDIFDYREVWALNGYLEPPISWIGLSKSLRASTHHAAALQFKRNVLASTFLPHPKFSRDAFRRLAYDFLVFGNGYLERRANRLGGTLRYECAPAKFMRRTEDLSDFVMVTEGLEVHTFSPGSIFHLMEPDINQEVYGLPEYLGMLQSAWLNEAATLFRRRYFENGSHAGYILYLNDSSISEEDLNSVRETIMNTRGQGNFKNIFLYSPNRNGGEKSALQMLPISEASAKDEFFNIKNVTRDDLLAAHRVPPQLIGIVPSNTGGFGAADTAARVFARNEIVPLQQQFLAINDWVGENIVQFSDYVIPNAVPTIQDKS
ncbi:phage portal protein [Burkholderia gladioli]|uniref:phage portal protein n=1 Tax=Burkholderia gladioli TaxID=28095 RepID=UPI00163FB89D|nr:phage portal protein [Burkholderia gladioli]